MQRTTRPGDRGAGASTDDTLDLPRVLWSQHPFRVGNELCEMVVLVRAAAACDAVHLDQWLLQLGNNELVMDKLRQILAFRFDIYCFEDIALPMLTLLSSRKFTGSVHASDVKKVLRVLQGELLFFRRVCNCIESSKSRLEANGLLATSVGALAGVLNVMARKLADCAMDDEFYKLTKGVATWVRKQQSEDSEDAEGRDFTAALKSLEDTLEICMEVVPARRPTRVSSTLRYLMTGIRDLRIDRVPTETSTAGFERGPRHDNDAEDFRKIRVVPTEEEICSLETPYLPPRPAAGASMDTHLEFHFRLLREDAVAQFRRGVQWVLQPATLARGLGSIDWSPPRGSDIPQLNVARDLLVEQLRGSLYKGVTLQISVAQPSIKDKNKESLKAFWQRDQWFNTGSLVCIALNVSPDPDPTIPVDLNSSWSDHNRSEEEDEAFPRSVIVGAEKLMFATVCDCNLSERATNLSRFTVNLKFDHVDDLTRLATAPIRSDRTLLIEARRLFFTAYEPVLRTLQQYGSHTLTDKFQQSLFGNTTTTRSGRQEKPEYARKISSYDFDLLVRKDTRYHVDLTDVPVGDFAQLVRRLSVYERHDCLLVDKSQLEAFAAAMTQQVSLIQGPPGTGKSYVGTKIVKALLNQPMLNVGPILCVCYTNHALDQFLEGLVEDGVPLHDIVRVGGRSKSEALCTRSLSTLQRGAPKSRQERYRFGQILRQVREIEENHLADVVESLTIPSVFLDWMELHQPKEFGAIVRSEDNGGVSQPEEWSRSAIWRAWEQGESRPTQHGQVHSCLETGSTKSLLGTQLWSMSPKERHQCSELWKQQWRESARASIKVHTNEHIKISTEAEELSIASSLRILRAGKVVGATTTGCAINQKLIRALAPTIVVCEEAGEVLEAHLLACLSDTTQQLIQIGDHKQLRPIVNEYELSFECRNSEHSLDVSMFERLVSERTGNETGRVQTPGSLVTLHMQRRMRPEICDLIRRTLYPQLVDGPNVLSYPDTRGFTHNLWFFDHDNHEDSGAISQTNAFEADFLVELVAYAIKQGYTSNEVTILTPYLGQLLLIRNRLQSKSFRLALSEKDEDAIRLAGVEDSSESSGDDEPKSVSVKRMNECVQLSTVDNFQGNESHLVFISTVRNNTSGAIGFLKTFNRVNVMLSRARSAMFMLGSASTIRRCRNAEMFNKVINIFDDTGAIGRTISLRCQLHGTVTTVSSAHEIKEKTPDGGCGLTCDAHLRCGHRCPRLCHPDDTRHETALCMETCLKHLPHCSHLCEERCSAPCRCRATIQEYELPCGHVVHDTPCREVTSGAAASATCSARVEMEFPGCRHRCVLACPDAKKLRSSIRIGSPFAPWTSPIKCGQCERRSQLFRQPCCRFLECGDFCIASHDPSTPCPPCQELICRLSPSFSAWPRPGQRVDSSDSDGEDEEGSCDESRYFSDGDDGGWEDYYDD